MSALMETSSAHTQASRGLAQEARKTRLTGAFPAVKFVSAMLADYIIT